MEKSLRFATAAVDEDGGCAASDGAHWGEARMNATRILLAMLVAASVARAQTGAMMPSAAPQVSTPPADILTAPSQPTHYPPGSYAAGCGPHGCNGPIGKNGPLTYEIYTINGVSLPVGGSPLSASITTGYSTGAGTRTLWFSPERDTAWIFDLSLIYTYNKGQGDRTITVATPRVAPIVIDPNTGQPTGGERIADGLAPYAIRALNRTNFSFGFGRDWFLWGPGDLQSEQDSNFRIGSDIGGRWGSASVDLVPRADSTNYLKRGGVTHSVYIGMHADGERPMGSWIFTYGVRAEWGYTFTNLVPPLGGDIHDVNILFTFGARF